MKMIDRIRTMAPPPARRTALLFLLLLLLSGCALVAPRYLEEEQRDLNRHRGRWDEQGLQDYRFQARRICFCPREAAGPVTVVVRGGEVVSVTRVDGGEPLGDMYLELWPAVGGLFAFVQDAIDREAHRLRVEYDPELGYPAEISVDYDEQVVDEEQGIIVESLEALGAG